MKKLWLFFLIAVMAWGCAQPPTAPTTTNIYAGNNDGNGAPSSPSTSQCVNPDRVDLDVPGTIEHGTPVNIDAIPTVAGQVQNSNVCAVEWTAQAPCFVGNAGSLQTTLNASAQDLSGCAVQARVGDTVSGVAIVAVN